MKSIYSIFISLLFAAVVFTACNADPGKEGAADSTTTSVDSVQPVTTPADTSKALPDTMPKRVP